MTKTMAEVLAEHYFDNWTRERYCACGEPLGDWGGYTELSAHQATALSAAGFGFVADAGAKALEELAGKLDTYAANVSNNNHILNPLWDGLADGYKRAAEHARAEASAVRGEG